MNCDQNIHDELISQKLMTCPFCDEQLQHTSTKRIPCCNKQVMVKNEDIHVCRSCGTVGSYIVTNQ